MSKEKIYKKLVPTAQDFAVRKTLNIYFTCSYVWLIST